MQLNKFEFDKGVDCMGKIVIAIMATILFGYAGIIIGAMLNLEGYLGVIFAIATMGAFILHSIESKE